MYNAVGHLLALQPHANHWSSAADVHGLQQNLPLSGSHKWQPHNEAGRTPEDFTRNMQTGLPIASSKQANSVRLRQQCTQVINCEPGLKESQVLSTNLLRTY